jgi:acyl dehydratase
MSGFYVKVGDQVQFAKTIGESDVYLFAGITGDLSPNHVNQEVMKRSAYGQRIAHGVLIVGFMSTTSTLMIEKANAGRPPAGETPVSLGYDRIRFLAPVFIGDTVTGSQPARRAGRDRPAHPQMGRKSGRGTAVTASGDRRERPGALDGTVRRTPSERGRQGADAGPRRPCASARQTL